LANSQVVTEVPLPLTRPGVLTVQSIGAQQRFIENINGVAREFLGLRDPRTGDRLLGDQGVSYRDIRNFFSGGADPRFLLTAAASPFHGRSEAPKYLVVSFSANTVRSERPKLGEAMMRAIEEHLRALKAGGHPAELVIAPFGMPSNDESSGEMKAIRGWMRRLQDAGIAVHDLSALHDEQLDKSLILGADRVIAPDSGYAWVSRFLNPRVITVTTDRGVTTEAARRNRGIPHPEIPGSNVGWRSAVGSYVPIFELSPNIIDDPLDLPHIDVAKAAAALKKELERAPGDEGVADFDAQFGATPDFTAVVARRLAHSDDTEPLNQVGAMCRDGLLVWSQDGEQVTRWIAELRLDERYLGDAQQSIDVLSTWAGPHADSIDEAWVHRLIRDANTHGIRYGTDEGLTYLAAAYRAVSRLPAGRSALRQRLQSELSTALQRMDRSPEQKLGFVRHDLPRIDPALALREEHALAPPAATRPHDSSGEDTLCPFKPLAK
jgi:hypothetical protein